MAEDAGHHHEHAAAQGQGGDHKPPQRALVLLLAHPLDEDGQVHQVDGDDGQLRGVKDERTGPNAGQVGAVEIQEPGCGDQQCEDSGVGGHVGLTIQLSVDLGRRTFVTGSHGVHAAAAAQHQAVGRAQAGDHNEQIENIAQHAAEDVCKGHSSALVDELLVGSAAGDTDVIQNVHGRNDDAA